MRIAVCPGRRGNESHPSAYATEIDGRWRFRHRGRGWVLLPGVEIGAVFERFECERCGPVAVADLDVHEYVPDPARDA